MDGLARYRGRYTRRVLRTSPAPARSVTLTTWITHHPSRPDLPARLLALLADSAASRVRATRLVFDPHPGGPPNPWRTYRVALERAAATSSTHHLVIQDDALPCPGLLDAAHHAARWRPDAILCLFVNDLAVQTSHRIRDAAARGAGWAPVAGEAFLPTVATVWPAELAAAALAGTAPPDPARPQADDGVLGDWVRAERLSVWATVPNLVQHDEDAPSTFLGHRDGRQRWATCWIGEYAWRRVPFGVDF